MKWLPNAVAVLTALVLVSADKNSPKSAPTPNEEQAVAALRRLDADVTFQTKGRVRGIFFPTSTNDDALVYLEGFDELKVLHLRHTKITDAGLRNLRGLNKLRYLYLVGTEVSDAGLVHLQGLPSLREIRLDGTRVTDAGLEYLKSLPNLTRLDLRNTKVTDEGVGKFQQARPMCAVKR